MISFLDNLQFAVFEFTLTPHRNLTLPDFKTNLFRGALGKTLRRLTCVHKETQMDCSSCLLCAQCIYSQIFESPHANSGSILGKVDQAPHPFILYMPDRQRLEYNRENPLCFYLTLVGKAIPYIPYFILAFEEIGKYGIGPVRTPFDISRVSVSGVEIYSPVEKRVSTRFPVMTGGEVVGGILKGEKSELFVQFVTPVRLKYERGYRKYVTFEILVRNLLRRLQLLGALYCGGPVRVDFSDLIEKSREIKVSSSQVHWEVQQRFSYRQEVTQSLGGVLGDITYVGEIGVFMPYLRLGEFLHVGKGTAFGLGKFKLSNL